MQRIAKKLSTESADDLLQKFKIKVTGNIMWAGGITVLLLTVAQLLIGNTAQGSVMLVAGVFFIGMAWRYHGRRIPIIIRLSFIGLLSAITAMSIVLNSYIGVYWTYPLLVACFFLFSGRQGIGAAAVLTLLFSTVAFVSLPLNDSWRVCASLAIILVLGAVFAVLLEQLQQLLRKLVVTDTLTGVQNRHLVTQVLEEASYRFARYRRPSSIIMADLDHFKKLNDAHGHLFGDQILKQVAERMRSVLRQNDQLFRVGGEEFLIVLAEAQLSDALRVADKLKNTIAQTPFRGKTTEVEVTLSLGVAEVVKDQPWVEWLNRADTALLEAKRKGRNQVRKASSVSRDASLQL